MGYCPCCGQYVDDTPRWHLNELGEWWWPLLAYDQTYHLRVWFTLGEWHAAIVEDGEYDHHIIPVATAELAKSAITVKARILLLHNKRYTLPPLKGCLDARNSDVD